LAQIVIKAHCHLQGEKNASDMETLGGKEVVQLRLIWGEVQCR